MATIRKRGDKYQVQVRRVGQPQVSKTFHELKDAKRWAREQERSLDTSGLPLTIDALRKITVGEIVQRYLDEKTPKKQGHESEAAVLKKFLERDICKLSLAAVTRQDAYRYRDDRLKETFRGRPITPRTVRRQINSIQHVFETAKEEWGYNNLVNPFRGLKVKGSKHRRKRRLVEGELHKLIAACDDCRGLNELYVPLAIYLAIETGMRLQEIFNLRWADIDQQAKRIEVTKSKTDHVSEHTGRTIVLTYMAEKKLEALCLKLHVERAFPRTSEPIFPITKDAFEQSWRDVVKRAGITGLQFRDLRREAGSRFDEAGLSKRQNELMMGHLANDTNSIYIASDLKLIREKLDRFQLDMFEREFANAGDGDKERLCAAIATFKHERLGLKASDANSDSGRARYALPQASVIPFPAPASR